MQQDRRFAAKHSHTQIAKGWTTSNLLLTNPDCQHSLWTPRCFYGTLACRSCSCSAHGESSNGDELGILSIYKYILVFFRTSSLRQHTDLTGLAEIKLNWVLGQSAPTTLSIVRKVWFVYISISLVKKILPLNQFAHINEAPTLSEHIKCGEAESMGPAVRYWASLSHHEGVFTYPYLNSFSHRNISINTISFADFQIPNLSRQPQSCQGSIPTCGG